MKHVEIFLAKKHNHLNYERGEWKTFSENDQNTQMQVPVQVDLLNAREKNFSSE